MNEGHPFAHIKDLEFSPQTDLTSYTTFRLAAKGDLFTIRSEAALAQLLPLLKQMKKEILVIGWGANQILPSVSDKAFIYLQFPLPEFSFESFKDEYEIPASAGLNQLTSAAIKHGLKGWEVFTGIPASLGGAIYMNAGTNLGEIGPLVKRVRLMTSEGSIREEIITQKSFSYRKNHFVREGEVILSAVLGHQGQDGLLSQKIKEYLEYRKRTQPLATKNCGCVFKNPQKQLQAGRLIDQLGLKGLTVGPLRISDKHANFMENHGAANWDQFSTLVKSVQYYADSFYGIEFELEVKIPYH
jgi:UDP-N-acetylmuramate dehydrogenase